MQPTWETLWSFLKKLKLGLPCDPDGYISKQNEDVNLKRHNMCSPVFTSVLLTIAKIWKQSMSINRQIGKDVVYILKY